MDLSSLDLLPGSFRDPAGYVFTENGVIKRAVTETGRADFDRLTESGLYERLVSKSFLIPHQVESRSSHPAGVYKILIPEPIRYISYPYEWSFGQLRDAAILTLRTQQEALRFGMSLKDASAFNIQFRGCRATFIDTLSFEANGGGPWVAYNQFCRHFLAPLALMSHVSLPFNQYLRVALDGLPLDLASSLAPKATYLKAGLLIHLHLHAKSQRRYAKSSSASTWESKSAPDRKSAIADSLLATVKSLKLKTKESEWIHYYRDADHYSDEAERAKRAAVEKALDRLKPSLVYDLGGNVGTYGRLATKRGAYCVCCDLDPLCVHRNYELSRQDGDSNMHPLVMDMTNPSPALGFSLEERMSLLERPRADLGLALALIHHLRITGNAPLSRIAFFFSQMTKRLLIEYVPKDDPMAQTLLRSRADTFYDYDYETFLKAFGEFFVLEEYVPLPGVERTICIFRGKNPNG